MIPKNGRPNLKNVDLEKYADAWADMMKKIWKDRLAHYRVGLSKTATGNLFSSVKGNAPVVDGISADFVFQFATYGIYVDAGTGNGYYRGNGGELIFLEKDYRKVNKLGKPRQKKPWFRRSWYISQRVLADKFTDLIGERYSAMFDNMAE